MATLPLENPPETPAGESTVSPVEPAAKTPKPTLVKSDSAGTEAATPDTAEPPAADKTDPEKTPEPITVKHDTVNGEAPPQTAETKPEAAPLPDAPPPLPSLLTSPAPDAGQKRSYRFGKHLQSALKSATRRESASPTPQPSSASSFADESLTSLRHWLAAKKLGRFTNRWLFAALAVAVLCVHALLIYVIDSSEPQTGAPTRISGKAPPAKPETVTEPETATPPVLPQAREDTIPPPVQDEVILQLLRRP